MNSAVPVQVAVWLHCSRLTEGSDPTQHILLSVSAEEIRTHSLVHHLVLDHSQCCTVIIPLIKDQWALICFQMFLVWYVRLSEVNELNRLDDHSNQMMIPWRWTFCSCILAVCRTGFCSSGVGCCPAQILLCCLVGDRKEVNKGRDALLYNQSTSKGFIQTKSWATSCLPL